MIHHAWHLRQPRRRVCRRSGSGLFLACRPRTVTQSRPAIALRARAAHRDELRRWGEWQADGRREERELRWLKDELEALKSWGTSAADWVVWGSDSTATVVVGRSA